jgi:hypothetical protein
MIALLLAKISSLYRYVATEVICTISIFKDIKNFLTGNTGKHQCLLLPAFI